MGGSFLTSLAAGIGINKLYDNAVRKPRKEARQAQRAEDAAKAKAQQKIDARNNRIQTMKTRLYENDNGLFGNKVNDNDIGGI